MLRATIPVGGRLVLLAPSCAAWHGRERRRRDQNEGCGVGHGLESAANGLVLALLSPAHTMPAHPAPCAPQAPILPKLARLYITSKANAGPKAPPPAPPTADWLLRARPAATQVRKGGGGWRAHQGAMHTRVEHQAGSTWHVGKPGRATPRLLQAPLTQSLARPCFNPTVQPHPQHHTTNMRARPCAGARALVRRAVRPDPRGAAAVHVRHVARAHHGRRGGGVQRVGPAGPQPAATQVGGCGNQCVCGGGRRAGGRARMVAVNGSAEGGPTGVLVRARELLSCISHACTDTCTHAPTCSPTHTRAGRSPPARWTCTSRAWMGPAWRRWWRRARGSFRWDW